MPASLRTLIDDGSFPVRALAAVDGATLDRPITWVHSSDLVDPTPWLEPGNLLLTNGAQFGADPDAEQVAVYCAGLRDLGAAGLGFATEVIHDAVPPAVVRACAEAGLPLIEIGGRAPFIGIIRFVADLIAADRAAREAWLLDAQRQVARAAVRDDGLREILGVLSRLLDTWVALYDAAGVRIDLPGLPATPSDREAAVGTEVHRLLERATAASLQLPAPDGALLQTIGRSARLRGVLAVGARDAFDPAEKDLVATVVALASVALEQQRQLQAALRGVRTGVLDMLLDGRGETAHRVAATALGGLPVAPLSVAVIRAGASAPGVLDDLDVVATDPRRIFFAERADDVIALVETESVEVVRALVSRRRLRAGVCDHLAETDLAVDLHRAALAAREADPAELRSYAEVASRGLVGALRERGGPLVARSLLQPLDALADDERDRLLVSAREWLDANGAWDPAARGLGIHRHTLKARIAHLERVLRLDLSSFAARAELWAALQLTDT